MPDTTLPAPRPAGTAEASVETSFVSFVLAGQLCGVSVLGVRDILGPQAINPIPLAPPEVAGSLNLRGRIVTAVDLRRRLRLPPPPPGTQSVAIVVEQSGELYALLVDQVSEVMALAIDGCETGMVTLPPTWARHSAGIHRLPQGLMVVLDIHRLLDFSADAQASAA